MKKLRFFYIFFVISGAFSQEFNFVFEPEAFPVTIEGWQPYCPWAGGYSESAPDFCDIDADGDLDLFVGEYFGYIKYFRNDGTVDSADYSYITAQYDSIYTSESRNTPCFRDLDNDSDMDLIFGDIDGFVYYYENTGSIQNPDYTFVTNNLVTYGPPWCLNPEIVDIDNDGDFDVFGGNYGQISFFINNGNSASYSFELITGEFSNINVGDRASPEFIDIDSDHDYDLFIGDVDGNIHYYRNDGDSVNWDYTLVSDNFLGIDVGDYASPEFADVDGDGDYDLFIGCDYSTGGSSRVGNIYYYQNTGSSAYYNFQFVTKNYLCLDVGGTTIPQFVDMNNDGKPDFITTSYYQLVYYENTGIISQPEFTFVEENFQGIDINGIHPWFVDIDADGDYDLLCGEAAIPGPPTLSLYINRGTAEEPELLLYDENFITNPDFSVNLQPSCADLDGDGDYDMILTDDNGYFYYYRNDGDETWPDFTYVTYNWQELYSFENRSWRMLAFGDLDSDEDLDLLLENIVENDLGNLRYFRNDGSVYDPVMTEVTNVFLPGFHFYSGSPVLTDIDVDGDLDLFVGEMSGGIMFFRNLGDSTGVASNPKIQPYTFTLHPNYPNPFNAATTLTFNLSSSGKVSLKVYDITGREAASLVTGHLSLGQHSVVWNAEGIASGVYLVRLSVDSGLQTTAMKTILIK